MPKVEPLRPEQLCRRRDPGAFAFETTAELDDDHFVACHFAEELAL